MPNDAKANEMPSSMPPDVIIVAQHMTQSCRKDRPAILMKELAL
jgi:hypothetical protein